MEKIRRDTTKDLFLAALRLVKENGHYDKAGAIMDYVLPNDNEDNVRKDIELTNYLFDFNASAQFGGSEGIYIDCFLSGQYSETEIKRYNFGKGIIETETMRSIGTFKTLKDDLEAMKIMGELCGALIFYAHQYVNKNIKRYTPARELEQEERRKKAVLSLGSYIRRLASDIASGKAAVAFDNNACDDRQSAHTEGLEPLLRKEINKFALSGRYSRETNRFCEWLDGKFDPGNDCFEGYVTILMSGFPELSVFQAAGSVFTWLCTRKQDIIADPAHDGTA